MTLPIYLIITPYFPTPESWRGPFCYDFARALKRTGKFDVRVFVPGKGPDYEYGGIKVSRFRYYSLPWGLAPFLTERINTASFLKKVKSCDIDFADVAVCHSHEIFCLSLALAGKKKNNAIKVAHHFHAMGHPFHVRIPHLGRLPIYSTLLYLYYKKLQQQIDLPVFVSKRQRSMFGRWYPNGFLSEPEDLRDSLTLGKWLKPINLKPSIVLYNGIDYSVFCPESSRRKNDESIFTIGDVANFCESKDQMTLIKAVEKLVADDGVKVKIKCVLVGSGETLQSCRDYVTSHGLRNHVEFRTEMDHLELPDFYRSLDLFVSPSWAEGFGCTFVEAYGCGTPIVGCEDVSVDECFSEAERCKWLVPRQDDEALANRIKWYIINRPQQKFVHDFDIDRLVGEYVATLEDMLVQ